MYDLIVIGAGPGGYPAALKAAGFGKKVAVIENQQPGGTCLNCGCIPTKTLLHTASLLREVSHGKTFGLIAPSVQIQEEALCQWKNQVIETLRDGILQKFKKAGIVLYEGVGTISATGQVKVMNKEGEIQALSTKHILIAAGSGPAMPPIPGANLTVSSDELLEKPDTDCKSLIIVGGGVIGMEFAQIYSDLGARVTVLEAMDRVLPGLDREISQNLKMILKKRGADIHTGAWLKEISQEAEGFLCRYEEKGKEAVISGQRVLMAIGRKPNTEALFSSELAEEIKMEKGYISVDHQYRTNLPGIYAVGDVIGGIQLAHVATAEGISAIEHMFDMERTYDMEVVPSCIYTDPEIASVGLTEEEAKARGLEVCTGKYIMSVNGKSVLTAQDRGFIKIVAEKESGRVLGAQMMCARATDMTGELGLAISRGMTASQLAAVIMPHPTFSEGIGEAAALCTGK